MIEQLEQENDAYAALIARRLAKVRDQLNMSQQDLANKFNTTQNLIYRLENGLKVSREMFTMISLYFIRTHQVNYEWLYNPDVETEPAIPMFTNDLVRRKKINEQREAERLVLLQRFREELNKVGDD
jgi:transcriptional regulator with XRE-family HTH domain